MSVDFVDNENPLDKRDIVAWLHRKSRKNEIMEGMTPEEASDVVSNKIADVLRVVIREEFKKIGLKSKSTTNV